MKFRQDISVGYDLPKSWLSWGKVRSWNSNRYPPTLDYFLLRFPSYRIKHLMVWDKLSWHQLVFHYVSHGEWFDDCKQWHAGKTLRCGFDWFPVGDPIESSPGLK